MTAEPRLSREEIIGLGLAVAAHVLLMIALLVQVRLADPPRAPPERITVSLATDVSLENTAPDPSANPAAAVAPVVAALPEPEAISVPTPDQPAAQPVPPRPQPTRAQPTRTVQPRPTASPSPRPTARPTAAPTARPTTRPAPTATSTPRPASTQRTGAPRLGDDFLPGSSDADGNSGSPAARFGPAEQASLASAITRQLKPHWSAPSGVDVEQLVTVLSWELNPDGSLRGAPRVVSQTGITASNRPQASLHAERAIRAVQLAAPFNLPDQYYDRWRRVSEWRFDRRL